MSESHATPPASRPHLRLTPTTSVEEFDALADLFLGPSPAPSRESDDEATLSTPLEPAHTDPHEIGLPPTLREPEAPGPVPRPASIEVEAMLLGHLPVLASAWVRQHAAARAASLGGPVALVRLQAGTLTVELVGHDPADPANLAERAPMQAVATAYRHASAMLVRVDETAEPQLLESPAVTGVTVLSAADEAAVVGSYRVIKAASDGAGDRRITVAWMGSPPDRVEEARAKLDRAVEHFLTVELRHEPVTGRLDATTARTIYRGQCDLDIATLLRSLTMPTPHVGADVAADVVADVVPEVVVVPRGRVDRPAPPRPADAPQPAHSIAPPLKSEPEPASNAASAGACPLPGLTAVAVRCPDATTVQLALDGRGHLHLLALAEAGDVSPAEAVEHLLTAAAWARKHRDLLALALPRLASVDALQMHLLTDRPKHVRGLLDAEIRLHALTRINVAGRTHTATVELN